MTLTWTDHPTGLTDDVMRVEQPSTVSELRALLDGLPDQMPILDGYSESPVVIVTSDYVGVG